MTSETRTLKGMFFQLVETECLSTQGQHDVNLHRLTRLLGAPPLPGCRGASSQLKPTLETGVFMERFQRGFKR